MTVHQHEMASRIRSFLQNLTINSRDSQHKAASRTWEHTTRRMYSSYTIDTFSFTVSLSLKNHPLYAAGRKFAHYGWVRPTQPPTHGMTGAEVTSHGKETSTTAPMDRAANIQLSPRTRATDRARLRAHHPHRHSTPKAPAKGGTPK
jgi:hypothetical protein